MITSLCCFICDCLLVVLSMNDSVYPLFNVALSFPINKLHKQYFKELAYIYYDKRF